MSKWMATFLLAGFVGSLTSSGNAQQYTCDSRAVENALQRPVKERYGPPAFAQIQAIGAGQPVQMRMNITEMQKVGDLGDGFGGLICAANGTFWRQDTGQTVTFSAQFWVVSDPRYGSQIQVKSIRP
jgi:hypothetical protein